MSHTNLQVLNQAKQKKKIGIRPLGPAVARRTFSRGCNWSAMGMDQVWLKDKKNTLFCGPHQN
jgi:hypothetical protein